MISIGFSGVSLQRGGRTLLARAHLALGPGELCVVTGARGAGKSLLLATAAGAVPPSEGSVFIAGRDLGALQSSARPYVRRNIGYLPPEPPLVREETALENVMLALGVRGFGPAEAEHIALRALADLGAEACARQAVKLLSVGERRLVALARALAGPPPIAIVDEPTAGLGDDDRARVAEALLATRAAGAAVLCASNDGLLLEALAAQGGRLLYLRNAGLEGDRGVVRVVGGGAAAEGGVVLGFPGYPPGSAREVS
jgi:ABC-type multidrug transport system ATPase subunit